MSHAQHLLINERITMLIITQNLRHWGGDRFEQLIKTCIGHDPDVLILTERRNNKQKLYESLNTHYYQYAIQDVADIKNTVCVLTKKPSHLVSTYKNNVITLVSGWITIRWVYFPQKNEKKEVFEYISSTIVDTSSLVIGDFNTWKHFIDEKWKTFYCDQEFAYLSEQKMSDARRTRHNNTKDYSRYSNAGNWFRIDHIVVTQDIQEQTQDVGYDHSIREQGLSDHSMMYINIAMEKPIS
jgi:exonuclease III